MKSNEELNLPESLRYTDEHVWVRMEGGEAVIGISDFAQDQLGEIAFPPWVCGSMPGATSARSNPSNRSINCICPSPARSSP